MASFNKIWGNSYGYRFVNDVLLSGNRSSVPAFSKKAKGNAA